MFTISPTFCRTSSAPKTRFGCYLTALYSNGDGGPEQREFRNRVLKGNTDYDRFDFDGYPKDPSLKSQSVGNNDGWGIAYYQRHSDQAMVYKQPTFAIQDSGFDTAVDRAIARRSPVILGHVRLRAGGERLLENTHPFVYENWALIHNGTTNDRHATRQKYAEDQEVYRKLLPKIINTLGIKPGGTTGSEFLFLLFMTVLKHKERKQSSPMTLEDTRLTYAQVLDKMARIASGNCILTSIVTNGEYIMGFRSQRSGLYLGKLTYPNGACEYILSSKAQSKLADKQYPIEWFEIPPDHIVTISKNEQEQGQVQIHPLQAVLDQDLESQMEEIRTYRTYS